jgi:malate/lactate dehydrogenase
LSARPISRRPRWRSTPRSSVDRVAIAGGAGGVGSSLAYSLLLRPEPFDVVVIDRRPEKVASHVMDLEQVINSARPPAAIP